MGENKPPEERTARAEGQTITATLRAAAQHPRYSHAHQPLAQPVPNADSNGAAGYFTRQSLLLFQIR